MTDSKDNRGEYMPRMFAADIATDLAEGRSLELAEIYALDALSDAERAAVDAHIENAPEAEREAFRERVRQAREALSRGFASEQEPPAGLLDRIMNALPAETVQTGEAADVVDIQTARGGRTSRQTRNYKRAGGTRGWLLAAAAAVALALGGVGVGSYLAGQNDPLNQVYTAQDAREATVQVTGGGTAIVTVSPSHDAMVVRMKDVPAPPAGKVYQMWLIPKDGSAPVSQGLMDAEALSKPAVVKGISSAAALGITVEPVGGSKTPTLPTVAAAPLGT